MKKIAVMGLYNFENLGDPIITRCVKYLVDQEGYESIAVGFQPERNGRRFEKYRKLRKIVSKYSPQISKDLLYYLIMKWFVTPHCEKIIKDCDALIFGVGSYKYSTQNLWMTISIAIDIANKYKKPVMIHGVNIEKYDASDWRCRHLAKRTNYNVVKVISTRDGLEGIDRLKNYYLNTDSNISLFDVGDSAFWLNECFDYIQKDRSNIIGINLIRFGIFKDYGIEFSDEKLLQLYIDILKNLDKNGYKWELFCNGLKEDVEFGKAVLKAYNDNDNRKIKCFTDCKELIDSIGGYKAIIGARLHACIIAYMTDTPLVCFYWDNKLVRFAADNKLEDRFCYVKELSGEKMVENLFCTINNPYDYDIRDNWKEKNRRALRFFLENYV